MGLPGLFVLQILAIAILNVEGLNNGLAQRPPLAWSNWNIVGGEGEVPGQPSSSPAILHCQQPSQDLACLSVQ